MTSWRPDGDQAWNYLRLSPEAKKHLQFEAQGDGQYELVVGAGWPSKVATNRLDGSYATRDLFIKHPILNAWKYSGRIDDVIVLENGEKANPLAIEGAVRQHEYVAEAVVFGVGKPHFGIAIILSPAAVGLSREEVIDQLSPVIESSQQILPTYAKISRDMVVLMPAETEYPRTDKGTVIRKAFYRRFSEKIDSVYNDNAPTTIELWSESDLREFIRSEAQKVLELPENASFGNDTDFFQSGMDSLQASQLRAVLTRRVNTNGRRLNLNIVFDYPSTRALAHELHLIQLGSSTEVQSTTTEIMELINKYGQFKKHIPQLDMSHLEGQCIVSSSCPFKRVSKVYLTPESRLSQEQPAPWALIFSPS